MTGKVNTEEGISAAGKRRRREARENSFENDTSRASALQNTCSDTENHLRIYRLINILKYSEVVCASPCAANMYMFEYVCALVLVCVQ